MHIIKYKWITSGISGEPFLFGIENKKTERLKMFDETLRLKIGKRLCVGYYKNGRHIACPNSRQVNSEKICRECALNDDFFFCMKCTGEECINEPQRPSCKKNSYYIYLAAFGHVLKVGISYEHRLLERLIEQGADMGAKIGKVTDGKLVREIEQEIRKDLNIKDRLTGAEKQKLLFGNLNTSALNIFNAFNKLKSNGVSKYLIGPEIYNFVDTYRLNCVTGMPTVFNPTEGSELRGQIVAAKGNIIVFKNESGLFSVNAHALVGLDVDVD